MVVNSIVPSSSDLECILIGQRRSLGLVTDRFEEEVAISKNRSERGPICRKTSFRESESSVSSPQHTGLKEITSC